MGRRRPSVLRAAPAIALAAIALASEAYAAPTVWARATDPLADRAEEVTRAAMKADRQFHEMARAGGHAQLAPLTLREPAKKLAALIADGENSFGVRMLYVELLRDLRDGEEELKVLTSVLKDSPPAPVRADALSELAICHAIAGRREEEIRAYTAALAVEPHTLSRARLFGNRAEALMATGDLQAAIDGYRAALARVTTLEMFQIGSTTLFGLGVALDRNGDLEAAVESVKLARAYDPSDKRLRGPGWFFSPPWDSHWYWALGGLTTGRSSGIWAARAEGYATAVAEWELYLQEAPEDDRWLPLARARLAAAKHEQAEMMKAYLEAEKKRDKAPPRPRRPLPAGDE